MSTVIKISPEKAIIYPAGGDDQIISGIQLETDPNRLLLRIKAGRVRINGLFFDINHRMETNCSGAPLGRSLIAIDQTLNLSFIDDNIPADKLVIGVVDKSMVGGSFLLFITQIEYLISGTLSAAPGDVFAPTVSLETQLRMLFDELAINKQRDANLRYEELLESLPPEYNSAFVETFAGTTYFLSNELIHNPYSHVVALGILPPYVTSAKKLVEKVTLANPISSAYLSIDCVTNDQSINIRFSFDNGLTWQVYSGDAYYSAAGAGKDFLIEFVLQTGFTNVSPQLRSWALFYNKL